MIRWILMTMALLAVPHPALGELGEDMVRTVRALCQHRAAAPDVHCAVLELEGLTFFVVEYCSPAAVALPDLVEALGELGTVFCGAMRDSGRPARFVAAVRSERQAQVYDCDRRRWRPPFLYDRDGGVIQEWGRQ